MNTYPQMPIITAQYPKVQLTSGLVELRGANEFLETQYLELAELFGKHEKNDLSSKSSKTTGLRDWPQAPIPRSVGRHLLQEHFINEVNANRTNLFNKASVVVNPAQTIIYFLPKCFKCDQWINNTFSLNGIMLKAKFLGANDPYFFYLNREDSIYAALSIGYGVLSNKPQAFLLVRQRGKDFIWELEDFSMISPITGVYDQSYKPLDFDSDRVAFICFSKERELMYSATPKVGSGLFNADDDEKAASAANDGAKVKAG